MQMEKLTTEKHQLKLRLSKHIYPYHAIKRLFQNPGTILKQVMTRRNNVKAQ